MNPGERRNRHPRSEYRVALPPHPFPALLLAAQTRPALCLRLNIWNYLLQYFNIYYIDFALNAL